MLYLYPSNTTDFSWNGDPIHGAYDSEVVRNKEFYHDFKVILDDEGSYKKIKRGMIVTAKTPDGVQPFRIWDITQNEDHIEVNSLHVLYDLSTKTIKGINVKDYLLGAVLDNFKSQLSVPFNFSTGITKTRDFRTSREDEKDPPRVNALDVFMSGEESIVGTWGAEIYFNGFDIRLMEGLGKQTNALIYEHKNISSFENKESNRELCTRIYAKSTYTPERKEGDENEPKEIKIEVVVDSPLINQYEQVHEKEFINNDIHTKEELIKWAKQKFEVEKLDLPKRTIQIGTNIVDGTIINYGDTVVLKYIKHDIDETIRCVGYKYNGITGDYIEIELGSNVETVGDNVRSTVIDATGQNIANKLKRIEEKNTVVGMASNGFNRIAWGSNPVPNPIKEDRWFRFSHDHPNDVEVLVYDGQDWIIEIDNFLGSRVEEKLDSIESQLTQATAKANEIAKQADESIQRFDSELSSMREKLESLGLPQESIDKALDSFKRQLDEVARKTDATVEMIGNDGVTRYNKNILKGEFKRTVDYDAGKTEIVANDGGFKKGQTYTISFDAVCKLILQSEFVLEFVAPTINRRVNFKLVPTRKRLQTHADSTVNETWKKTIPQDRYTATVTSDWYKTVSRSINHNKITKEVISLAYRDYVEGDISTDRLFDWSNNCDLLIESNL